MRRASFAFPFVTLATLASLVLAASSALAQEPEPLPPPPPPPPGSQEPAPPPQQQYPQQPYQQQPQYPQQQQYPQQPYQQQPQYQQPPQYYQPPAYRQPGYRQPRPAPPPVEYNPPPLPTHAPKYSLWVGPRLNFVGFGFSFYINELGHAETTGNFVGNGVAPEIDLGARISHRYIPYIFYKHGFLAQGHRFVGTDATSSTESYGIGFRFLSGDVDAVAFMSDLSIGKRVVRVVNGSQTYEMSGLELFNLALGAEIRLDTLFTLEPAVSISGGTLTDTSGSIDFAPNQPDGRTHPTFQNGDSIVDTRPYVVLEIGVGFHFDFFGK